MELFYQLLALFKYLASMGKGDFSISDYPLRYQYQGLGTSKKLTPWIVRIVGWEVMSGLGDTKPQALQDLKIRLDEYKKSNVSLPRPGTKVPLRFASTELIGCFPLSFIDDFLKSIFGIETALVTDESSLFDHGSCGGSFSNCYFSPKVQKTLKI